MAAEQVPEQQIPKVWEGCRGLVYRQLAVWAALVATGCGGASLVLKPPISDACSQTGLKGCPKLTDGIILFVEGKKSSARRKIAGAVADNAPAELKLFAKALKTLGSVPGVQQHMQPILEVVALLESSGDDSSEETSQKTRKSKKTAKSGTGALPSRFVVLSAADDVTRLRTKTYFPGSRLSKDCGDTLPFDGSTAKCSRARRGPFVITDIQSGGSCKLFIASGEIDDKPTWLLRSPFALHSSRLLIPEGERLIIGRFDPSDDCFLTISGFKPY